MLAEFRYSSFREAVAAFEKLGLFDGTVIQPTRVLNGESVSNPQNAFSSKPWQWKEFATALADLAARKPAEEVCNNEPKRIKRLNLGRGCRRFPRH